MSTLPPLELDLRPRCIAPDPPMSDEEFEAFCFAQDLMRVERTSQGAMWMNPPAGRETTRANSEITYRLHAWWSKHERGEVTDSSGGFYLADGSMLSPDAAYVLPETLKKIWRYYEG